MIKIDIPYGLILDPYIEGEEWRDIPDYEGYFQGSSLGRIRSVDRSITYQNGGVRFYKGKILKQHYDKDGYLKIGLNKKGKERVFSVHVLIALCFILNDDPINKVFINHKNEIKDDNRVNNLEWCTPQYNATYGHAIEKRAKSKSIPIMQLTEDDEIVKIYNSSISVKKDFGYSQRHIRACCTGHEKRYCGYKWIFLKNYNRKLTEEEVEYYKNKEPPILENTCKIKVVQLTRHGEFIRQYNSITEAANEIRAKCITLIAKCCKNTINKAYGYKWMYLEDYENLKK